MDLVFLLLRLVHIGAGVFWVGGAFTFFLFVAPSTEVLAPAARQAFIEQLAVRRRFPVIVLAAATLTILAGASLYWLNSTGLSSPWIASPSGLGFAIGGICGFGAWLIAAFVIAPTFGALSELGASLVEAGRPPTAEETARIAALSARLQLASRLLLVLLAIAVALMAVSRYLQ